MPCEFYSLTWCGKHLHTKPINESDINFSKALTPAAPLQIHSCLGDDNKLWCEVYRAPGQSGGVFIMRDFDDALIVAKADDNMSFLRGLDFFAQIVSNSRYGADIFENADDED